MNNYLEKLRFTLTLENINNKTVNPKIFLGVDDEVIAEHVVNSGKNEIVVDAVIYESSSHSFWFTVDDKESPNDINSVIVKDLKIHGVSVTYNLFQCVYFPSYDPSYLNEHPDLPTQFENRLYIGNNGTWKWFFESPIYENKKYKIGLW